jgi:two-component system, LytTR family, sensor kinase
MFLFRKEKNLLFDDTWLRLISLPILSLIIPPLFVRETYHNSHEYWMKVGISLLFSIVIWEGNRFIFLRMNVRFSGVAEQSKRLFYIVSMCLIYTVIAISFIHEMLCRVFLKYTNLIAPPVLKIYGASFIILLAIGAVYESVRLFYLWKKAVSEKDQLERIHVQSQLEGLKSQVNPHFLFNSLNTLVNLIPENPETAVRFVQKLSKVYRYILEIRDKKISTLSDEMDFLNAFVFLHKERFGDNLQVHIHDVKAYQHLMILPLSLQILFENAIKHNIISLEKPLHIDVFVSSEGFINQPILGEKFGSSEGFKTLPTLYSNPVLVVRNNLQLKNQVMDSTGFGLQNIKDRFRILSNKEVEVIVSKTHFTVVLPMI